MMPRCLCSRQRFAVSDQYVHARNIGASADLTAMIRVRVRPPSPPGTCSNTCHDQSMATMPSHCGFCGLLWTPQKAEIMSKKCVIFVCACFFRANPYLFKKLPASVTGCSGERTKNRHISGAPSGATTGTTAFMHITAQEMAASPVVRYSGKLPNGFARIRLPDASRTGLRRREEESSPHVAGEEATVMYLATSAPDGNHGLPRSAAD